MRLPEGSTSERFGQTTAEMASRRGIEPPTYGLGNRRSSFELPRREEAGGTYKLKMLMKGTSYALKLVRCVGDAPARSAWKADILLT